MTKVINYIWAVPRHDLFIAYKYIVSAQRQSFLFNNNYIPFPEDIEDKDKRILSIKTLDGECYLITLTKDEALEFFNAWEWYLKEKTND